MAKIRPSLPAAAEETTPALNGRSSVGKERSPATMKRPSRCACGKHAYHPFIFKGRLAHLNAKYADVRRQHKASASKAVNKLDAAATVAPPKTPNNAKTHELGSDSPDPSEPTQNMRDLRAAARSRKLMALSSKDRDHEKEPDRAAQTAETQANQTLFRATTRFEPDDEVRGQSPGVTDDEDSRSTPEVEEDSSEGPVPSPDHSAITIDVSEPCTPTK